MITYNNGKQVFKWESWDDVISQYPAMWIVFDRVDFDGSDVHSGEILNILPDEEVIDFENKHRKEIVLCLRTTEDAGMPEGYIHGEIVGA